jgi:hypothetical protein
MHNTDKHAKAGVVVVERLVLARYLRTLIETRNRHLTADPRADAPS